jgi:hypothetical protein
VDIIPQTARLCFFFTQCGRELHQFLVCAGDVNIVGGSVGTKKKNTKSLVVVVRRLD